MDSAHLGGDRQHAQRPGLPARLPPDGQPARRRGPHPGSLRPRLPLLSTYTPGTFEGWLHRITTNLFLDMVRRKQRIRFDALGDDAAERLPSREPSPQQVFNDAHFDADVQQALDTLAPEFRAAVVLCDIEDFRTRRSPRPWASSSVRSAAGSTVAVRSCARPWHTGLPRPVPSAAASRSREFPRWEEGRDRVSGSRPDSTERRVADQHLGDRLSALVDGELGHESRDRVLAHLVTCAKCKAEADAQRRLKNVFAEVAPPPPPRASWPVSRDCPGR